jgi:hypothetical protein
MGFIVDLSAQVTCTHQAKVTLVPFPRVTINGQAVVVQSSTPPIVGCPGVPPSIPPCATVTWTMGATRVTAGGTPVVLLESALSSKCPPNPTPALITVTQTRVSAL